MISFLQRLRAHSDRLANKTALEFHDEDGRRQDVTYGELELRVRRAMALLQARGVVAGDRVALQLPKCLPFHRSLPGHDAPGGDLRAAQPGLPAARAALLPGGRRRAPLFGACGPWRRGWRRFLRIYQG